MADPCALLLQDGTELLLEDGVTPFILEDCISTPHVQMAGKSLGRRGPFFPDRTPEQVLREEDEIISLIG